MKGKTSLRIGIVGSLLTAESPLLKAFSSAGCLELMVTKGKLESVMADHAKTP
jgi:hypothetical protein